MGRASSCRSWCQLSVCSSNFLLQSRQIRTFTLSSPTQTQVTTLEFWNLTSNRALITWLSCDHPSDALPATLVSNSSSSASVNLIMTWMCLPLQVRCITTSWSTAAGWSLFIPVRRRWETWPSSWQRGKLRPVQRPHPHAPSTSCCTCWSFRCELLPFCSLWF